MQEINYEYYVSPEVAKLLKEAGFDLEVNHSYPDVSALDNSCSGYMEDLPFYHNLNDGKYGGLSAPTLEVAQRWLREVKGYIVLVNYNEFLKTFYYSICYTKNTNRYIDDRDDCRDTSFEEAQESGIKKALEIILEL